MLQNSKQTKKQTNKKKTAKSMCISLRSCFRFVVLYLKAMFGLGPEVRSMTELGAALLVLSRGGKKEHMCQIWTSPKLRLAKLLSTQCPHV